MTDERCPESPVLLALGAGGSRGMAHIGVIRTLEEEGFAIRGVAGSSIGASVGAAYCAGILDAYEQRMRAMTRKDVLTLLDPGLPTSGLFGGARLERLMRELCGERSIEDLERAFLAIAVDLSTGKEVRIDRGDVVGAVRASGSIPGLFRPVRRDGRWLVDGALASPVPVNAARALGPHPVIAVNLNIPADGPLGQSPGPHDPTQAESADLEEQGEAQQEESANRASIPEAMARRAAETRARIGRRFESMRHSMRQASGPRSPGIIGALNESIAIICNHLTQAQLDLHRPELLIEPRLGDVGMFDLHRTDELIAEGARATREALEAAGAEPLRTRFPAPGTSAHQAP